ncbi:MAG TPA: hypothetical protein VMV29_08850 [Ktedonobacterales bacterium]|nr:hypothetical protein [Ktedonobacterales bacterium]
MSESTVDTPTVREARQGRAVFLRSMGPDEAAQTLDWAWGVWRQHLEQDWPAVLAENEALRAVVEAVAQLQARESFEFPKGKRDVVLHHDSINVLWVREQARKALGKGDADGE